MSERLQNLVNDFADIEIAICNLAMRIGELPAAIDTLGRELNAGGKKVRACEVGRAHSIIGHAFEGLMNVQASIMDAHCFLIEKAEGDAIPLPQPRAGGR